MKILNHSDKAYSPKISIRKKKKKKSKSRDLEPVKCRNQFTCAGLKCLGRKGQKAKENWLVVLSIASHTRLRIFKSHDKLNPKLSLRFRLTLQSVTGYLIYNCTMLTTQCAVEWLLPTTYLKCGQSSQYFFPKIQILALARVNPIWGLIQWG